MSSSVTTYTKEEIKDLIIADLEKKMPGNAEHVAVYKTQVSRDFHCDDWINGTACITVELKL